MNKTKGFTLIEMLFVLQLIIIFGLFHLPYFNNDIQQSEIIIQEIINTIETYGKVIDDIDVLELKEGKINA